MDTLNSDEKLQVNQFLQSANGQYQLVMQGDGNLVLYEQVPNSPRAAWDTGTWNLPAAHRPTYAVMQGDGNFVLYSATGYAAWATDTWNHPGARIVLQDDRNLVVYGSDGRVLWASNTWLPNNPTEIHAHQSDQVGYNKTMTVDVTLYRNGLLTVDSQQQNRNWTGGLRGRILVVCVDGAGHAIWVSQIFDCPTRCSVPDISCASDGRTTFTQQFPAPVGQYTARLDVHQYDGQDPVDFRTRLIRDIKETAEVAQAVKDFWNQLQ